MASRCVASCATIIVRWPQIRLPSRRWAFSYDFCNSCRAQTNILRRRTSSHVVAHRRTSSHIVAATRSRRFKATALHCQTDRPACIARKLRPSSVDLHIHTDQVPPRARDPARREIAHVSASAALCAWLAAYRCLSSPNRNSARSVFDRLLRQTHSMVCVGHSLRLRRVRILFTNHRWKNYRKES